MKRDSGLVDVTLRVLVVREKALLVTEDLRDKENKLISEWLPFSQVEIEGDHTQSIKPVTVTMPRWLYEEKGFTSDD